VFVGPSCPLLSIPRTGEQFQYHQRPFLLLNCLQFPPAGELQVSFFFIKGLPLRRTSIAVSPRRLNFSQFRTRAAPLRLRITRAGVSVFRAPAPPANFARARSGYSYSYSQAGTPRTLAVQYYPLHPTVCCILRLLSYCVPHSDPVLLYTDPSGHSSNACSAILPTAPTVCCILRLLSYCALHSNPVLLHTNPSGHSSNACSVVLPTVIIAVRLVVSSNITYTPAGTG